MLRPPRSRGRFQGEGTSLSNPYADADGTRMRRRYCVYTILAILALVGIIFAATKDKSSSSKQQSQQATASAPPGSYVVESQSTIDEIKAKVKIMKHKKSGMPILTIVPDDSSQDAVFGISFRTKVDDDSGIAYVVQKSIQDGSEHYDVKGPFNQLTRGSLQTYMENWIDKDRASFTYASRNRVDFTSGLNVYLDGIFNPNLMSDDHDWIFRQEAWRFLRDGNSLLVTGNAINEAKVAQMDPQLAHEDYVYRTIFNGHPYQYMQKGDFREVVTLTRTKVRDFYTKYYHPSNGRGFCFGPQDFVDECLNVMEPYLSKYEANDKIRKASEVGWKELGKISSIQESVPYASYQNTNDFRFAYSYALNAQPMDDRTKMIWYIIEDLLVGSTAAVIPRVIVEDSLGDDYFGGLQAYLRQWVLTIGVSGISDEDKVGEARIRIKQRIYKIVKEGFDDAALKGTLNKLDMRFREQSSQGAPVGVRMFKDVLTTWTYDEDPRNALSYSKVFAALKKEIEENGQGVLLQLMSKHMVDSQYELATKLIPSTDLLNLYKSQEQEWLDNLPNIITTEQALDILKETDELIEVQQTSDSQAVLAKISLLTVRDLRTMNFEIPSKIYNDVFDSGITLLEHEVPNSNGIAYVDYSIDISNMDFDDIVLLPLFSELLVTAGNNYQNGVEIQRQIDAMTGGLTVQAIVEEIVDVASDGSYVVPTGQNMVTKMVVRSSCLASSGCIPMFNVIKQVIFDTDVQKQAKVIEILKKMIDDMEDDVQRNPQVYTSTRILSQYGLPGFIREQWQGITQLLNLRRALYQARNDWEALSLRLILMADAMRRGHRNGMTLSLTGDKGSIKGIASGIELFIKDILPSATQSTRFPDFAKVAHPWYTKGLKRWTDEVNAEGENEAFLSPTRMNSVAKGGLLFDPRETIKGSDFVALQYIGGYYLYSELRFGQGAADALAILDIDTGSVVYQSNQAPNIFETLDIYDNAASFLLREVDGKSSLPPEAEGAVIGTIGMIDGTALQPSDIGYISLIDYLKQDTKESRQKFRDQVLATNPASILAMADRLGSWGKPSIAVITNTEQYDTATAKGIKLTTCSYTGVSC